MINQLERFLVKTLVFFVKGYRYFLSPLLGSNCRFYPTCSQYCIDVLGREGLVKGLALTMTQLLKCHPFYCSKSTEKTE